MITWPIFLALFLSVVAVYASIKAEKAKENKKQRQIEMDEFKRADLEKRKKLFENEKETILE